MKIGVFGLGYVGIVNVACLSKNGHTVWCTDVKPQKVQYVRDGKSPIKEPEVEELIAAGVKNGNIIPVNSAAEVVANADVFITCVGTPSKADGEVNLDYLNNVIFEIVSLLKPDDHKYLVFRSTVPPGTTEKIVNTHLADNFPNVVPVFYPEFLREGSAVKDFYDYGRIVLGMNDTSKQHALVELFNVCPTAEVFVTDYRTAEYAKYIDNGFHALKVAFANEIFGLAAEHGVNIDISHRIFVSDNKLNISPRYLKPGLPFGGSCLPKDVRELQHLIHHSPRNFPLLQSIIPSNESFIQAIHEKIKGFNKKSIAFIGITFKNHSDDLRESPVLKLFSMLKDEGYQIAVYDDDLNFDTVRIEFPNLFSSIKTLENCMEQAELVIVSKRYLERTEGLKKAGQVIFNMAELNQKTNDEFFNLYG